MIMTALQRSQQQNNELVYNSHFMNIPKLTVIASLIIVVDIRVRDFPTSKLVQKM